MIIGLTGGIACGKSTVARLLVARGAALVDADRIARDVVEPGSPALVAIAQTFGGEMIQADGRLDRPRLGALLADQPNFAAAAAFYLLYVAGIVYFAVLPSVAGGNWMSAALAGALLGLFAYATYDLTNMATLREWPIAITIVDIAWGMLVTAAAAVAGYLVTTSFALPANPPA